MIAVLVPHLNPPSVIETTRDGLVLMVTDASSTTTHTSSIPPGLMAGEFKTAWAILTKDLRSAKHFDNARLALAYYRESSDGISVRQHAQILSALGRIETRPDEVERESPADDSRKTMTR